MLLCVRGNVASAVVAASLLTGCGGTALLASDAGPVHDATTHDVASIDAGPLDANTGQPDEGPPACEGGAYFITVRTDGGATVLLGGCESPGVPTLGSGPVCSCAEDCPSSASICGMSDAGFLSLFFTTWGAGAYDLGCFGRNLGTWSTGPDMYVITGGGIHLPTIPALGGAASGDYVATLSGDGGATISGTFCVLRVQ